jgi:hypothetical protein
MKVAAVDFYVTDALHYGDKAIQATVRDTPASLEPSKGWRTLSNQARDRLSIDKIKIFYLFFK